MVEAGLEGLSLLFRWEALAFVVVGVVAGVVIAAIPGIGSVPMLGILVPFTFSMEPFSAFALFLGFLAAGVMADSIPAILLGIPGSASSQATILDGYALARQGKAGRALGASFSASMLGGLFGALVLSVTIQAMEPVVLAFGVPEFLAMGLWGVSMVGMLAGRAPMKGLSVGAIGLVVGAIGLSPGDGIPRWTFDKPYFYEGIDLALVGIGIFAVPELVSLVVRRSRVSDAGASTEGHRGQLHGIRDTFRHKGTFMRSSALGTLVGVIPGIGSAVVDWIVYGLTVQWAKDKSRFGRGDIRGVIGVDGANNAIAGGTMVPTFAFGIPGGATMAFLLVMFMGQGMTPGTSMLTDPDSLTIVYFFIWGLALANIVAAAVCLAASGMLVAFTGIRHYYLFSVLIPVMFVAAYHTSSNVYDIFVLLILSLLGYLFKQYGWPRAPILVGIVLSRVVESNLHLSMNLYGPAWAARPIVLVIWALLIAGLVLTVRWSRPDGSAATAGDASAEPAERASVQHGEASTSGGKGPAVSATAGGRQSFGDRFLRSGGWFTAVLLAVTVWALAEATTWPRAAWLYPVAIGVPLAALLAAQLVKDARVSVAADRVQLVDLPPDLADAPGVAFRRAGLAFAWILALFIAGLLGGFLLMLPAFTLAYLRFAAKLPLWRAIAAAVGVAAFVWGFDSLASIRWNTGLLFDVLR